MNLTTGNITVDTGNTKLQKKSEFQISAIVGSQKIKNVKITIELFDCLSAFKFAKDLSV